MNQALRFKVIACAIVVVIGAGTIIDIGYQDQKSTNFRGSLSTPIAVIVHNAAWYVAHPNSLKLDEARCAGDANTISQAACENVASAESIISESEMEKAATQNAAESSSEKLNGQ